MRIERGLELYSGPLSFWKGLNMIGDYKEVFFDVYCKECKHWNKPESVEPCRECLDNPAMVDSHKPMHFEKNDVNDKREKGKHGCPCKCS